MGLLGKCCHLGHKHWTCHGVSFWKESPLLISLALKLKLVGLLIVFVHVIGRKFSMSESQAAGYILFDPHPNPLVHQHRKAAQLQVAKQGDDVMQLFVFPLLKKKDFVPKAQKPTNRSSSRTNKNPATPPSPRSQGRTPFPCSRFCRWPSRATIACFWPSSSALKRSRRIWWICQTTR